MTNKNKKEKDYLSLMSDESVWEADNIDQKKKILLELETLRQKQAEETLNEVYNAIVEEWADEAEIKLEAIKRIIEKLKTKR